MSLTDEQSAIVDKYLNRYVRVREGEFAGTRGVATDWEQTFGPGDPVFKVQIAGGTRGPFKPEQLEPDE